MKRYIRKIITIVFIITINFILNISLGQGGGLFGHGPTPEGEGGGGGLFGRGGMSLGNNTNIYNQELGNVINTQYDGNDISGPLNDGAYWIVNGEGGNGQLSGLVGTDQKIDDYEDALGKILKTIQNVVNYTLGILSFIALLYLIINGFIILTAAGDDTKVKKGLKGIKNAFLAIAGIGLSWIIISFILRLINALTT